MRVYTRASDLAAVLAGSACFVGNAVFRAGNGCFGLAIAEGNLVAVHSHLKPNLYDRGIVVVDIF